MMNNFVAHFSRLGLLALASVLGASAVAAPQYNVIQLGNMPGYESGEPMAINNSNVVFGNSYAPGRTRAWIWTESTGLDGLSFGGHAHEIVRDLNESTFGAGHMSGWGSGARFQPGSVVGWGIPNGYVKGDAWGINNSKEMVGWATAANNRERATRFNLDYTHTMLPTLNPLTDSRARRVNDAGIAVGFSDDKAVLWTANNVLVNIHSLLPDATKSYAADINQAGWVTGYFENSENRTLGFMFNLEVGASVFSPVFGQKLIVPRAMNLHGDTVGLSRRNQDFGQIRAYLRRNNSEAVFLNDLIDPNSGWNLTEVHDINDNGYIVGRGTFNGVEANYLLTPAAVPEPGSMIALGVGLAALLKRRRR